MNSRPLDRRFSYLVYRAALRVRLRTLRTIKEAGEDLSPEQLVILLKLGESEGMSQRELASQTFIDKPSITRMIGKLEKMGLIRRRDNKKDGRAYKLFLTKKGGEVRNKLDKKVTEKKVLYQEFY